MALVTGRQTLFVPNNFEVAKLANLALGRVGLAERDSRVLICVSSGILEGLFRRLESRCTRLSVQQPVQVSTAYQLAT